MTTEISTREADRWFEGIATDLLGPGEGLPSCVRESSSFGDRHASWHDADPCPGDDRWDVVPLTRYTIRAGIGTFKPTPNHPYSHSLSPPDHMEVHTDDLEEAKVAWARAEHYVRTGLSEARPTAEDATPDRKSSAQSKGSTPTSSPTTSRGTSSAAKATGRRRRGTNTAKSFKPSTGVKLVKGEPGTTITF